MCLKKSQRSDVRHLILAQFSTLFCGSSKVGARWRDLPARYGNWNSIYHKFRRWCSLGFFERLLKLINSENENTTLLELDSTFCKVHQSACSGRKDQAVGASRGGKITKIHALVTENFQLIGLLLTGGTVCIPDKTNSRAFHNFDRDLYKARNGVERFFLRIKNRRRIATRYDKLAVCFLNFVFLSALMIQL